MIDNEKLVQFIRADWEAKKRAFDAALNSPFPPVVFVQIVPSPPQLPLRFGPDVEPPLRNREWP